MVRKKQPKQQKKLLTLLASATFLLVIAAITSSAYASVMAEKKCVMKDEVLSCLHTIDGQELTLTLTNNAEQILYDMSVSASSEDCQFEKLTQRLGKDVAPQETVSVTFTCQQGAPQDVDITVLYSNHELTRFARTGIVA